MDPKEQIIFNLNRENELLRMENAYLREQLQRVTNGLPIELPLDYKGQKQILPPLSSNNKHASSSKRLIKDELMESNDYQIELPVNKVTKECPLLRE